MQGLIDVWAMQNGVCPSPPRPFTTFQWFHDVHAPILAVMNSQWHRINKPFRFENWCQMENDFHYIAHQCAQHSFTCDFSIKTKFRVANIRKWRWNNPKNNDLLAQVENQLLQQQTLPPLLQNHTLQ
jgi:hypothetical protein